MVKKMCLAEKIEDLAYREPLEYEILNGHKILLAAPSEEHCDIQKACCYMIDKILEELNDENCGVYTEVFIRRYCQEVRPDVLFSCEEGKDYPKLLVEVVSESSKERDNEEKRLIYRDLGALEYWVINPWTKSVKVHDLVNQSEMTYTLGSSFDSKVLGYEIKVSNLFIKQYRSMVL